VSEIVIDASVLLKAYFRDEQGHVEAQELVKIYARGDYSFIAPSLITYEIKNACSIAHRKGRIQLDLARQVMGEMTSLEIQKMDVINLKERIFEIACQFNLSAYDASYIALAEAQKCPFITGDARLFRKASDQFPFIKLL
jgi:predicted nucleic acid-binding protein